MGSSKHVLSISAVGGGCISSARQVVLQDGEKLFIKLNHSDFVRHFEAERLGLIALQQTNTIKVPVPIGWGRFGSNSFLLLEWIESEKPRAGFSARLGEALASLHAHARPNSFGLEVDNFIGSTPQRNDLNTAWPDFFVENRLRFQLELAIQNQYSFPGLDLEKILAAIYQELPSPSQASLIHGDLWSGNYLVGSGNEPVLIDPAVYWADREAEFGILSMFGGFDEEFYAAYRRSLPFEPGFERRLPIYQLYHFLNHLNLFGNSYLDSCLRILKRFA